VRRSTLSLHTVIRRAGVPFTQLDDELLAIDAQQGLLFSLNETGGRVWDAIAEPSSVARVCETLAARYAVDDVTCQRDVLALVEQLRDARLVEVVGDGL
jgi:hypothetical protein